MGIALIKMKIMPTSPEVDLEELKERIKEVIEKNLGKPTDFSEEPIAFGLKAIIAGFELNESIELDSIEENLKEVENVNSVQVIDMRRAFG